ncbi:MAG: quinohemoprotein amine dehydrogenase subunit alpha [Phenylobacterium sp.]|uniref:quinohemoprotein amine dehydrogenase subunit alpha n=1 Tax=Phenylobacterium sp. TaxID=1871053 RepID=UPI001A5A9631|nr:quinohemoprotein amine dehydrogenase subunit alpha [Phenylobacterium sp.]MBL8771363.1 quinohemoprotein amine dehydrogenase subunit alpha [Phenylobacterium sp.]
MSVPQSGVGAPEGGQDDPGRSPARTASPLRRRAWPLALALAGVFSATVVGAQVTGGKPLGPDPVDWTETDPGIPVTDPLTTSKCGTCHAPDAKGNLSRISWVRATPELWAQTIKRMVKLHGAPVQPEEARRIVQYLGAYHGLAPEEAKPVMYLVERRIQDETNIPNETMRHACAACHAFAQPLSSRRSKREWALLQNMHVALYSQADAQYSRPPQGAPPGPPGPDGKPLLPGQVALNWLAEKAPLHTPEWAAWKPRIRPARLEGRWLVSATLPGKGRYLGEMTISPGPDPDRFVTTASLRSLETGAQITRKGQGVMYGGYSWRGSADGGSASQPDDPKGADREVMWFSPDMKLAQGRWFWGAYHEFGFNVTLTRASADPTVAAVSPAALKAGAKGVTVRIYGDALPKTVTPRDVDLGAGVTVTKVVSASPGELVVTADVADKALPGQRDVAVKGSVLVKALPVYDKVDYLKVTPETGLARLGGLKYDKGYEQFEVTGYANGPDGKPRTDDDVAIGPVPVTWSLEEFHTVTYDDDTSYVGALSSSALFTPSTEGPNPKRRFSRNNYGEVWVVATARDAKDRFGKPLVGKAYLVVTVPTYRRWDQAEITR